VEKSEIISRMLKRLKVSHSVLNAKYHRQEAEIIAQAGRKHAVTIATNMAGRGTDIMLGGNPDFLTRQELDPEAEESDYENTLARLRQQCAAEKKEVLAAGGLHIIGTERHESRRIDNQLRGRSGRQGDPGSSRFFLALDDDLMRIFGGEKMMSLMERLGMKEDEVIEHPWVNKSVENAQRRVEGHNFDIRKHLLDYDDVMNDQRIAVYKLRRGVIGATPEAAKEMLLDLVEEAIIQTVARACPERTHYDEWDMGMLEEMIREQFATEFQLPSMDDLSREELENKVYDAIEKSIAQKEELYTSEAFYGVARVIYLQTIDALWKDHLREMDQLRDGVSLRGYAQKDPKQEYKKEGFNLFSNMMATIGADVLQKVFRVVITAQTEEDYEQRLQRQREKQAKLMRLGPAAKKGAKPETVRREGKKVRPNEPCPCGSGKKYKKCCMRRQQTA
jgi:preprotein translocase subunit SecA